MIFALDAMTVTVNQRPLPSPAGHGCKMISLADAALAMLIYAIGDHEARCLYWDFAVLLADGKFEGDDVLDYTEEEIKTWASMARAYLLIKGDEQFR